LRKFTWHTNRILIFLEPEKYYSYFLFWDHASDQFNCYYINFQLPYQRSHCGFDTLDLDIDIVIDPQYNWKWKDEEEYELGIRQGGIRDEWVKGIEQAQGEVLERIRKRSYPLDRSWLRWRPTPTWIPPKLPDSWQTV
jgi:protein associated with RNAse G/E